MQDITVRLVLESDANSILSILKSTGWFDYLKAEAAPESEARIKRHIGLCRSDNSHSLYVAENEQGIVVGYAAVHWLPYLLLPAPEGYVSELFVEANQREQGIGKRLLATIIAEAKRRNCCRLMLLNGRSRESYQRSFYTKNGWSEREDIANFTLKL